MFHLTARIFRVVLARVRDRRQPVRRVVDRQKSSADGKDSYFEAENPSSRVSRRKNFDLLPLA
jgi:hypothetical protein